MSATRTLALCTLLGAIGLYLGHDLLHFLLADLLGWQALPQRAQSYERLLTALFSGQELDEILDLGQAFRG
jgi:hypothetical protein